MQNININDGSIKLTVNQDEHRVIQFNPNDLRFVNQFYGLIEEFGDKHKDYTQRAQELDKNKGLDEHGIPVNFSDRLALLQEICDYTRGKIDEIFGEGTSQVAFGASNTLDMFSQFFDGIVPYIQKAREGKIAKYASNREQRRSNSKVMR